MGTHLGGRRGHRTKGRNPYGVDGEPLEWAIQDAILEYLMVASANQRIKFWRARPSQYIRAQGSNVGFALHPSEIGMPDIMGVGYGWFIAMEVKRPGAKHRLSADQLRWRDDFLRATGTRYYVVRSVDDAIAALAELSGENPND